MKEACSPYHESDWGERFLSEDLHSHEPGRGLPDEAALASILFI